MVDYFVDPILKENLEKVKKRVLSRDKDWVAVIDGEEGCGKSVLAQQIASYLDPNFSVDKIVFNAQDFMKAITSPERKKGDCIILDEAFNAANSRGSMTSVNRSMVAVGTEMRQANLFVLIVLPSFFDLDKYFALWRCRILIHVYEDKRGRLGNFKIYTKNKKKMLYLNGKKTYSYYKPKASTPPLTFTNTYTVDEHLYRLKKRDAFVQRENNPVHNRYLAWLYFLALQLKEKNKQSFAETCRLLDIDESYFRKIQKNYESWKTEKQEIRNNNTILAKDKELTDPLYPSINP